MTFDASSVCRGGPGWLLSAAIAVSCLLAGRSLIHWFQLESYQHPGYFRTLRRHGVFAWLPGAALAAVCMLAGAGMLLAAGNGSPWLIAAGVSLPSVGAALLIRARSLKVKAKKQLVYTPRIRRLYAVAFVLYLLLIRGGSEAAGFFAAAAFPVALPLWTALAGLLAWPIEKAISEAYFRDAQRILREHPDLIRIGITGSWGKTSVKFILGTLLEQRFPTLITPASFNTPMGVTRIIRTKLEPGHRIFVAEMGARHVGDIREMCRLVHPEIGVLTSVGPQHLDTFKTQERITRTKYELMEAIPEDGKCFFADDEGIVLELYRKTEKEKYLAGLHPERDDTWAEQMSFSPEGSRFILCHGEERIPCETEMLGELNVRNIVLCAQICFSLGMTGQEIARGIRALKSVEHRLQLIRNPGGITVIDDAFNSNIRGAKQAFETLKEFPGRRIIVTPGMVELGDREEEMNREFGRAMAEACDTAVLVGKKRSIPLSEGLREGGFPEENIHVADSLAAAAELLKTLAGSGDTILFENDLPDNYSEE